MNVKNKRNENETRKLKVNNQLEKLQEKSN